MAVIQANRPSIDDRFSVLGFTVRSEEPLYEIGVAAHPDLLKAENRAKRTARNFYSSRVVRAPGTRRAESVYLVPPDVVAQFVGQPRLYFGIATYKEGDSQHPVSVKFPDAGSMYVSLSGLTERGLRRTARGRGAVSYGNGGTNGLTWGGDAVPTNGGAAPAARGGNGGVTAAPAAPAPYSDGYSDDLWKPPAAPASSAPALAPAPAPSASPAPTTQGLRRAPLAEPFRVVEPYDTPSSWFDALRIQLGHFASGALWFLGVADTTKPPYSAICQVRLPDGTAEGAHHGTAFFIAPRLLLTAGHVTAGQTDLIIVPGKNGGGISSTTEPFGRFHVTQFANHPSYAPAGDNDMALICVPAANASSNYFNLVEELTQSRPEGVVVSGYSALSESSSAVGDFVNRNIDENRQHAQGGYIREIPTDGTFTYDLQTLGGASGSPVYWIEDGDSPKVHMVGVHISGNDDRTNRGCRVTQEKLTWIRGVAAGWSQSLTFSMAIRALEKSEAPAEVDPDAFGISGDEPIEEGATEQSYRPRTLTLTVEQPDYPNASRFAAAHSGNYSRGRKRNTTVDRIVIHITAGAGRTDGTVSWFQNPAAKVSSHYIVGRDGEVVQMVRNADTAWHASSSNSRSIGIEHSANKPSSRNRRDLPPTERQYEESAKLVAWLCQQYGLPIDREHIVGHIEISPRDNHDCPTSYWDWDHYMTYVQVAAAALAAPAAAPATTQGVRAPLAKPLLVGPYDTPSSWFDALRTQISHFARGLAWVLGVPDTTTPPYSAICQVRVPDGTAEGAHSGTAFFIAPRLLLTAGHVVDGASELIIVPGKNGGGISSTTEPFGRFRTTQFSKHPSYAPTGDNDMALICVPAANASANYFNLVEELTQSRPEGVVVSGYAAWWYATSAIEHLVNAVIDENRQHMHGGYIRELPSDGTFLYDLQTLAGTSGSPVYWIEDGASPKVHLVGVHVAGNDDRTNKGCRVTQEKLSWIRRIAASWSQTLTFSMTVRALEAPPVDDSLYGVDGPIPDDTATSRSQGVRALTAPTPEYPQASRFVPADPGNYRSTTGRTIERVVIHITDGGANINGTVGWFQNPAAKVSSHYVIGQDGEVVQMVLHKDVAWHARSANGTSIGIEHVANTRGLRPTPAQMCASAALVVWLCDTYAIPVDRTHILGHSEADTKTTHTGCPNAVWDWDYYMRLITSRSCFAPDAAPAPTSQAYGRAQGIVVPGRTARTLGGGNADYTVSLIPQPDKNACWCASMAMLLSHRRQQSFTAESVANEVGASLATSYGWDLLNAVKSRYGFEVIPQPSNASIYNTPQQWADWLSDYGPLWVVIVGAPHAVVLAGIRGNLADPSTVQVHIFNPWDTRVAFDTDPITFNPANYGYEDWLSFTQFAADFGNMAEPDYGNWRILHLPASAATSQSLGTSRRFLAPPPAPVRVLNVDPEYKPESLVPIEPTRVPGTRMSVRGGHAGACRWALDQLEGFKEPSTLVPSVSSAAETSDVTIELRDWPAVEGEAAPLPLTVTFRATRRGAVGDVQIRAGTPANLTYGVEVTARIDGDGDVGNAAALKVGIDYRFSGFAQGTPAARIDLRLLGDGRYERVNRCENVAQPA